MSAEEGAQAGLKSVRGILTRRRYTFVFVGVAPEQRLLAFPVFLIEENTLPRAREARYRDGKDVSS